MTRTVLTALLSHWRANPLQLVTFLAGLALATALWSGVQAINAEARASYDAAAATLGEGQFDQVLPNAGDRIVLSDYVALRRSGWQVSPVVEGRLGDVRLIGLDPLTAPNGFGAVPQSEAVPLQDFLDPGVIYANAETAAQLDVPQRVVIVPSLAPNVALTDIGIAQALLDRDDLSRLIVAPAQPIGRPPLSDVAPNLRLAPSAQTADVGELTDSFHLNLTAFGLLSFAVGIFIVQSAIGLAFEQRRGMIRTLRALGVPLRRLTILIAAEMLALALIGGSIGVLLGYVMAAVLLPDVAATLRGLYGAEVAGTLQLRPEWWATGLGIAVAGTALAMAGRLWQVARMPLLASARPRAWSMQGGQVRVWQSLLATALLLVALILALLGKGLAAGFLLLGCLLIGAALALPLIVGAGLRWAEARSTHVLTGWFWADTRQQLPGLSLALMALLLAISANIGVSTMVSSFRLTFVAFLDQRLAPELYIALDDPAKSPVLDTFLGTNARETLPLLSRQEALQGVPSQLYGIRVGPTYRENWVFLAQMPNTWDRVAAGEATVLNEQLARRAGLWVGDTLDLGGITLPVVGVVADYGNPLGQAIVSETVFQTLHPDAVALRFGARTDDPEALKQRLISTLNLPPSAITDQQAIKGFSLAVFERTFTVTAALNVLTMAVAGFAMLMSLLTLADLRVPQLAPVWAMGLTRRDLGRLELVRAVALAGIVALCALPLGLALAWVLLAIVNVEAFGWRLPMFLFPVDYTRLGLYALIAAVLAAAWPAWRLMRTPPSTLLKVFANER